MARNPRRRRGRVAPRTPLDEVDGAYSLLVLTENALIAARDPNGFRPLALAELGDGRRCFASESCAFDLLGARLLRELEPGEVVVVREGEARATALSRGAGGQALRLRARLLRPPRQRRLRRLGRRDAAPDGRPPRARGAGGRRRRGAGARLRAVRGARLQPRVGAPLRARPDPQPLRRPHLHRAEAVDPQLRRQGQAQSGREIIARQAGSCWSTTRSCAARPRARSCA